MGRVTTRRPVVRRSATGTVRRPDTLAVEEPMQIRIDGSDLTITMRTPGNDVELVLGFLHAEAIIADRADVDTIRYCDGADEDGANTYNVLDVTLRDATGSVVPADPRSFLTTSACGVCGKTSLDQVRTKSRFDVAGTELRVATRVLADMPETLREHQRVFAATGGLHAAGLFTADGELVVLREDVGRHNAVDKVIGWAVDNNRIPATELVLIVSGRASFELVQKSVMAGIPVLGAVSAPSSLAVDLAEEAGTTLVGFLRGESMNIYSCAERIE
ncbi:formate dehydrogenase accessory sulfurtransferase FdhD [Aldersonia sp. NBC_00410]|uniref:formate dehydrogenase accessory sulfurtransferase FdhD n=1 Tax=Aldersonia sp. NBC_00410 TaxID=2975954 RepID=UPI00225A28C4|nr:formate dehydrogenase accessory sulfurtransferase FdhD [Aldersonia sp. NBC_00410]MCX5042792.1 formate dehydrogenase accessory sulfurtransferase FdhD [Aldersonia sp. NBC_00410]